LSLQENAMPRPDGSQIQLRHIFVDMTVANVPVEAAEQPR